MINAIIVEDSRLARVELVTQLKKIKEINLLGEAENISQALTLFNATKPELVFLDIDLPDGSGFDFLTQLETAPKVIFTTAYEEYALQAFESNTIDYVLKPVTFERLQMACDKLKQIVANEASVSNTAMSLESQFFVKDGDKCWLIKLSQVTRFESLGNYTRVYFEQHTPLVHRTLAQIENRLPQDKFFRVNRQNIVQLDSIQHVEMCSSGRLELTLQSGEKTEVSRRQTSVFKSLLSL
jgi:two-component system, LytTR family, response regulator